MVLPIPRWAEGESRTFSRPLSRQPAWPPRRTAFRDAGLGGAKTDFQAGSLPAPPSFPGGSQARVPALGHLLAARESTHPGQAIPLLGNLEKLRAIGDCGDLVPDLRGPHARGVQGRSGGCDRGAGSGAAGRRGAAPGEGLRAVPGSQAQAVDGSGPHAPGRESPRCCRGCRGLSLSPPREPEPPH